MQKRSKTTTSRFAPAWHAGQHRSVVGTAEIVDLGICLAGFRGLPSTATAIPRLAGYGYRYGPKFTHPHRVGHLNRGSVRRLMRALRILVEELEQDRSPDEPDRLCRRVEALDRLEAYLLDERLPALGTHSVEEGIYHRAKALSAQLEAANFELYRAIRREIQRGAGPDVLLQWVPKSGRGFDAADLAQGEGYHYLDELIIILTS